MKKITAVILALMMVLALTQCKKHKDGTDAPEGAKVRVTCRVPMNNDGKSEFGSIMNDGKIKWSAGTERIYLMLPDENTPQIVELTATPTMQSNVLIFEGEVFDNRIDEGEYDIWYFGNSKELNSPYYDEIKDGDVITGIRGSIANQSGSLDDLGYCHIAKATVRSEISGNDVVLSLNGTMSNQIAIAHLDLSGVEYLKGTAIIGTEYEMYYDTEKENFHFAVLEDYLSNINVDKGTSESYVVMFPNATDNVSLKSNISSKKITFADGIETNNIYCKRISDETYGPLAWVDYDESQEPQEPEVGDYDYVDLGLPSNLLWATCNVGASAPEDYGNRYTWGSLIDWSIDKSCNTNEKLMADISGNVQYDVATAVWADSWRMPTNDEMRELIDNCDWTWTTQNGVNGYKVSAKNNSNYIFLPCAGYAAVNNYECDAGEHGYYWSSTGENYGYYNEAKALKFDSQNRTSNFLEYRSNGFSVRPVCGGGFESPAPQYAQVKIDKFTDITSTSVVYHCTVTEDSGSDVTARGICWCLSPGTPYIDENENNYTVDGEGMGSFTGVITGLTPGERYHIRAYVTNGAGTRYSDLHYAVTYESDFENGHGFVELGLPSGLKWATCNVGAENPDDYGNYYAWGETEPNNVYTIDECSTYYENDLYNIYGNPQYDAAATHWGGKWRMPTNVEMQELIDNCDWTWTTQNGVYGYEVKSRSSVNSIFIPAAGYRDNEELENAGTQGRYWCGTRPDPEHQGHCHKFEDNVNVCSTEYRYYGFAIRPVFE